MANAAIRGSRCHVRRVDVTEPVPRATYQVVVESGLGYTKARVLAATIDAWLREREGHTTPARRAVSSGAGDT